VRVRLPSVSRVLPGLLLALTPFLSLASPGSLARRDLAVEEQRGGHTLSRHVGKTDEQLRDNLEATHVTLTSEDLAALDRVSALPAEYPGWMLARQAAGRVPDTARVS
jgi:hypothetical protein